tara:strand:+ start:109 stop:306 length:198 start_codon:yes stop_codon:yes gene_type:complete
MINLEEHKVYIESHKMDMIPYSIAVQALQQAVQSTEGKLDEALDLIKTSLYNIDLNDKDSTRSSD